ncbi:MAG: transcriptional regulator [Thermoplasmata archaeon]|nr:MAG: transcriptional regulator [Thermoplasmata archaeon]RLF40439.1 MAG: transcriptional regulator [Thermoplasmata archaeon]RLF61829.1 MAG: transcriptional regulator [Thermoplasmata archaeon]HDN51138.1 transcriptional regulator [Thermoplasmatales archaeon]
MKFPCEELASTIIPAIRAEIAIKLSRNHGMKQVEISRILGITQSAVSHYITSFRGKQREIIMSNPTIEEKIDEMATMMVNGEFNEDHICTLCRSIRELLSSDFNHSL